MSSSKHVLFAVGKLVKAFGLNGELILHPMTDSRRRLTKLKRVFVGPSEETAKETTVEHVRVGERSVRVKLSSVDDRTGAECLAGAFVFVDEKDRRRPPKGRYFIHDVVGLNVIDQRRGCIGSVAEVLRLPAHDVFVVRSGDREVMVPAVKEFIESIDLKAKRMNVHLIEGMVE